MTILLQDLANSACMHAYLLALAFQRLLEKEAAWHTAYLHPCSCGRIRVILGTKQATVDILESRQSLSRHLEWMRPQGVGSFQVLMCYSCLRACSLPGASFFLEVIRNEEQGSGIFTIAYQLTSLGVVSDRHSISADALYTTLHT